MVSVGVYTLVSRNWKITQRSSPFVDLPKALCECKKDLCAQKWCMMTMTFFNDWYNGQCYTTLSLSVKTGAHITVARLLQYNYNVIALIQSALTTQSNREFRNFMMHVILSLCVALPLELQHNYTYGLITDKIFLPLQIPSHELRKIHSGEICCFFFWCFKPPSLCSNKSSFRVVAQ